MSFKISERRKEKYLSYRFYVANLWYEGATRVPMSFFFFLYLMYQGRLPCAFVKHLFLFVVFKTTVRTGRKYLIRNMWCSNRISTFSPLFLFFDLFLFLFFYILELVPRYNGLKCFRQTNFSDDSQRG